MIRYDVDDLNRQLSLLNTSFNILCKLPVSMQKNQCMLYMNNHKNVSQDAFVFIIQ